MMIAKSQMQHDRPVRLYERVADDIAGMIAGGVMQPGDRLPSVRELRRRQNVSLATVLEAYRLLEDRGLITVRPQAGHYVTSGGMIRLEPSTSVPISDPREVTAGELILRVMRDTQSPSIRVPLGLALPSPAILPTKSLQRILVSLTRAEELASSTYELPPGSEVLRLQIARRLRSFGLAVSPSEIVITAGCQEALVLALRAICKPGDAVAIESPTYFNFLQAIEMLHLQALEIATHPREGMVLEQLEEAVQRHNVRACLLCTNFANPLGGCMPDAKKQKLAEICSKSGVTLIEDDILGDLPHGPVRPRTAKSFDTDGSVVLCSSFSKSLAPGYRIGWIVAGKYQNEVERLKATTNPSTPILPQLAVAKFLSTGAFDRHLRRTGRIYARQMNQAAQAVLHSFPTGTRVSRPSGGYLLWVECPASLDSIELYSRAAKVGISIAPGPMFSPGGTAFRNCFRISCGAWSSRVEGAVERLGEIARHMIGDRR